VKEYQADILNRGRPQHYTALKARLSPFLDINQEREFGYEVTAHVELARQLALTMQSRGVGGSAQTGAVGEVSRVGCGVGSLTC